MVPLILVNSGADYVGLQLSYFQCHSDSEQVLKIAHLKSFKLGGRAGWLSCKRLYASMTSALLCTSKGPPHPPINLCILASENKFFVKEHEEEG